ncbi:MAG: hypothetical protein Q8O90_08245 [Elusimicrobiota bacterium]|nr:hypothetical protein [Elusimicrobiota bacterium]
MKPTLNDNLTKKKVLDLAGDVYFKRGQEYLADGCVEDFRQTGDSIRGTVLGSELYRVRLWHVRGQISYSCDCPLGRDGEFCKHLVAVSLAWLATADKREKTVSKPGVTEEDIRGHLAVLDREELIDLILKQAGVSGEFYDQLMRTAASSRAARRLRALPGSRLKAK